MHPLRQEQLDILTIRTGFAFVALASCVALHFVKRNKGVILFGDRRLEPIK